MNGGIRISERGFIFLSGFPPESIEVNGLKIKDEDKLICNNNSYSWKDLKELFESSEYLFCNLKYNDVPFSLTMEEIKLKRLPDIGYMIQESGLDLIQKEAKHTDSYISSFSFKNYLATISITKNDYLLFMLESNTLMGSVNKENVGVLVKSIEESNSIGRTHKEHLKMLVRTKNIAPVAVLNRIKKSA